MLNKDGRLWLYLNNCFNIDTNTLSTHTHTNNLTYKYKYMKQNTCNIAMITLDCREHIATFIIRIRGSSRTGIDISMTRTIGIFLSRLFSSIGYFLI
jgi:hypothetical protein